MRKIIMFNMVSIDGFFADKNNRIDWHMVDDEFNKFAIEQMENDTVGAMLFGRVTYDLFKSYWPVAATDPQTDPDNLKIANWINSKPKYVFSHTLNDTTWENSILLKGNIKDEVEKIKAEDGKDIIIYGSGSIVAELTKLNLIDEYRFMVAPVILGEGKSLFSGSSESEVFPKHVKFTSSRIFQSGTVLMNYTLES